MRPDHQPGTARPILLEVLGLRAGYHGADVLNGLDINLHRGTVHAVLGRNGAGKTTLLKCLAGPIDPASLERAIPASTQHATARSASTASTCSTTPTDVPPGLAWRSSRREGACSVPCPPQSTCAWQHARSDRTSPGLSTPFFP